ncbi:recombinase family protein [Bacillus sp. HNR-4]|uniref:recombinase family protein n=1 Tax=Bacillus sp. HNR-4 TaxID=2796141 RepID=UPI002378668F|nr:recombinase family protein [Bacillus sp. HNR-4]WDL93018.1 recombinase family protein [Bacillus sp. HNR-4]
MSQKIAYQRLEDILKKGSRIALYARYSTNKQDENAQIHSVRNFLSDYGCELLDDNIYLDPKTSAVKISMDQRKDLQKLIQDVKENKFDCIVSYKNDRIARNTKEHNEFRTEMQRLGMPVVLSSTREIYTAGEIVPLTIKDALTQIEPALIAERTRDTFSSKIENGEWTGGQAPYGYIYDKETERFGILDKRAEVVQEIFRLFKLGYGLQQIANKLTTDKRDIGQKWYKDKIKYIITNPFYAGYMTMNRYVKGKLQLKMETWTWSKKQENIPAIMSRDEWEYCFYLYVERRKSQTVRKSSTPFWLRDILHCNECQQPYKTKNQKTKSKRKNGDEVEYGKILYECRNCSLKLEAEKVHDKFKEDVGRVLKKLLENHRENLIQQTQLQIKKEHEEIANVQKELTNKRIKLIENIDVLDKRISQLYKDITTGKGLKANHTEDVLGKEDEQDDWNSKLVEILLTGRSQKHNDLEAIKQQQQLLEEKQERLNIAMNVLKNQYQDELLNFSFDPENVQSMRNFLLQFVQAVYVSKDMRLDYKIYENLISE